MCLSNDTAGTNDLHALCIAVAKSVLCPFQLTFLDLCYCYAKKILVFGLAIFTNFFCPTYFNQNLWIAVWIELG